MAALPRVVHNIQKEYFELNHRYRIEGLLGEGGMGRVFLAWDEHRKERIALKFLHSDHKPESLAEEFRLLTRLSHPNLIAIHDFHLEGAGLCNVKDLAGPCFSMPYLEGFPLDRLPQHTSLEQIQNIFVQLLSGLHFLHRRDLLHRDLKPANLFLSQDGPAKLLDFGLSGQQKGRTLPQGTLAYLAPEACWGEPEARSDLFSLGAVFYELLAKTPPYPRWPPQGNSDSLQPRPLRDSRPDLPTFFADAIHWLLKLSPGDRPASALAMLQYLRRHGLQLQSTYQGEFALPERLAYQKPVPHFDLADTALAVDPPQATAELIALRGPGGCGRSRFLEELRWRFQLRGGNWISIAANEAGDWLRLALSKLGKNPPQGGTSLADSIDLLIRSNSGAVALTCEDFHLWPEVSKQELRLFIESWPAKPSSLWLLLDCNDDWPSEVLDQVLKAIESHPKGATHQLPPLDNNQSLSLLRSAPLENEAPEAWLESAVKTCGGNPLLLIEALRIGSSEGFRKGPEQFGSLPEKMLASCRQRWNSLSEGARHFLTLAFARGSSVDLAELRELWSQESSDFESALWELESQGLLKRSSEAPQKREAAQPSLRKTWLEIFPKKSLQKTHQRWLKKLLSQSQTSPADGALAVSIAEQALGCHHRDFLKEWAAKAAEYFESQDRPESALYWYEALLPIAESPEERYTLQGSMAPLLYRMGRLADARQAYELWYQDRPDDETRLQGAKYFFYTAMVDFALGDFAKAQEGFEHCLEIGPIGKFASHHPYHARSLNFLAAIAKRNGNFEAAREMLAQAATLSSSDPSLRGDVEQRRGELELGQLNFDAALTHFRECREAFRTSASAQAEAVGEHLLALWARDFGRPSEALAFLERALELSRQSGATLQWARYLENRAIIAMDLCRYGVAWQDMERAKPTLEVFGTEEDRFLLRLHRAEFHSRIGEHSKAEAIFNTLEDDLTETWRSSALALKRGEHAIRRRDLARAEELFFHGLRCADKLEPQRRIPLLWVLNRVLAIARSSTDEAELNQTCFALLKNLKAPQYHLKSLALECWTADNSTLPELLPKLLSAIRSSNLLDLKISILGDTALLLARRDLKGVAKGLWQEFHHEWQRFCAALPEDMKMDIEKNRPEESLDAELLKLLASSQETGLARQEPNASTGAATPMVAAPSSAPGLSEQRFRQFSEISRQIAGKHELNEILERVMDAAIEFTGAERGFLILENPEAAKSPLLGYEVKTARHFNQQTLSGEDLQISMSAVQQAMHQGSTLLTANAQLDERLKAKKSVVQYQLKSILAVPLELEGKVLGAIYLDHRYAPNAFSEEDIVFLGAFSAQASLAVQKAKFIAELRDANSQLTQKVENQAQRIEVLSSELAQVRDELRYGYDEIIGQSPRMMELFHILDHVTDTLIPVWIYGESGTGKELIARSLHQNSSRKKGPYVAINCSAIPETLLESELFGHKRGAFTHADRDKPGLFETASGGTLFMDEVADMSMAMQVKLLRVLQEGEVRPVGANKSVKIDVRLVTASNKDLQQMVEAGNFRQDLFFRINGIMIRLPPLRERKEDLPLLINHLIQKLAKAYKLEPCKVSEEAYEKLVAYDWPGNIRQLESVLRNAMLFAQGKTLAAPLINLPSPTVSRGENKAGSTSDAKAREKAEERRLIVEALRRHHMNKPSAAEELGITLRCLYLRMDRHKIPKGKTVLAKYLGVAV